MRSGLVLLIVGAAGCNQLFGLDPTELAEHDGAVDRRDAGDSVDAMPCDPTSPADEDGDAVPDSCDNCPHLGNEQDDNDGDGVGDDCDPQEGRNDDILFFAGFPDGTAEGWVLQRGSWTASAGSFLQVDALEPSALAYHPFQLPPEAVISVSIDVIQELGEPTGTGVLAYAFDFPQGEPDGYECRVMAATNTSNVDLYIWAKAVSGLLASTPLAAPYQAGAHLDLQLLHTADGEMQCYVDAGVTSTVTVATSTVYGTGGIALRTVQSNTGFRYVVAIGPPPGD